MNTENHTLDRGHRPTVAAWSTTLFQRLLPLQRRNELDRRMRELVVREPEWAKVWFAGTISNLMLTLPLEDPWRHLSARVLVPHSEDLVRREIGNPPAATGAVNEHNRPFGSAVDAYDLAQPLFPSNEEDPALAALVDGLRPAAAALLAFCCDGWQQGLKALRALCDANHSSGDPQFLFETGTSALLWAAHRRRLYTGGEDFWYSGYEDFWPVETCIWWTSTADLIVAGQAYDMAYTEHRIIQENVSRTGPGL